jgi:hypothetical protein
MNRMALAAMAAAALCATPALAQRRDATSSLFVEGGGPGLLYSINYELLFDDDYGIRAGFGYQSLSANGSSGGGAPVSLFTVPILANYLVSFGSSALELGGGATIIKSNGAANGNGLAVSEAGTVVLGTAILGYRYQPADGGFQFRIGIEALVGKGLALSNPDPNKIGVLPWGYVSIGFSI